MKRFSCNILSLLFALLILYAGVGISVVQYCCNHCETAQSCCTTGCGKCHNAHHESDHSCKDKGCTATFYKLDLLKQACETTVSLPLLPLIGEQIYHYQPLTCLTDLEAILYESPPLLFHSRHYQALYAVFII